MINPIEKEKATILLIEDNWDVLDYMKSILTKDYKIEFARDGQQGIEGALGERTLGAGTRG